MSFYSAIQAELPHKRIFPRFAYYFWREVRGQTESLTSKETSRNVSDEYKLQRSLDAAVLNC